MRLDLMVNYLLFVLVVIQTAGVLTCLVNNIFLRNLLALKKVRLVRGGR